MKRAAFFLLAVAMVFSMATLHACNRRKPDNPDSGENIKPFDVEDKSYEQEPQ